MGSPSDDGKTVPVRDPVETNSVSVSSDEDVIPKGALDPVYEAKAKVLNHAVSHSPISYLATTMTRQFRVYEAGGIALVRQQTEQL